MHPPDKENAPAGQQGASENIQKNDATKAPPSQVQTALSPYQQAASALRALGYHVIALEPKDKRPLSSLTGWSKYCHSMPPQELHEEWLTLRGINVGVCLGEGIIGLDYDHDIDGLHAEIQKIVPLSPVSKKGAKGFTAFYHASNISSKSFKVGGEAVVEILSIGKQTVMPPSRHPDGMDYVWLTDTTLENTAKEALPEFTQEHADAIIAIFDARKKTKKKSAGDKHGAGEKRLSVDGQNEISDITDALKHIPADDYEIWYQVGMALKSELGEAGYPIYDDWSSKSSKYQGSHETRTKWDSFGGSGISIATVFHYAKEYGYSAAKRLTKKHKDVTSVTGVQDNNSADSTVTKDVTAAEDNVTSESKPYVPDASNRPRFMVFDDWYKGDKRQYRPGVWYFGIKAGKGDAPPTLTEQWVCSPLHVKAVTFDAQDNNFGRMLRFINPLERWREWAMPMELLRGSGEELRGELLAMGVEISPHAKDLLAIYLQSQHPKRQMRCALQVGWCDGSFVLPDKVIGTKAAEVIFQSGERGHDEYTRAGTLTGWRIGIAAHAIDNPLLMIAVSGAFAAPLLERCNAESGGIHFVGDSSTGKTGLIEAACSVWGGENYKRSWRATANGMEGVAAMFNDSLLALDEISECDPRDVGAIVYALGNGRGKQRASRTGNARGVKRWRCFVLSSGERTIETTMQEGGYRAKAGQSMRLPSLPVARCFGVWDNLHGLENGAALTDAIKLAAKMNHGYVGRAFLERLTRDSRDFCAVLERIKALSEFSVEDGEGQDKRIAGRFALVAMAGELATEYGLTGWPEGAAISAAAAGLKAWQTARGGRGNDETRQIIEKVSAFIERHGDGRFSSAEITNPDLASIRDRAGWWRDDGNNGRVYLFTADGLREALKGFDFKRALDVLQAAGALPASKDGERAKPQRIGKRPVRVYSIYADKLASSHES